MRESELAYRDGRGGGALLFEMRWQEGAVSERDIDRSPEGSEGRAERGPGARAQEAAVAA